MAPKYTKVKVDDLVGSSSSSTGDSNQYRQASLNSPEFKVECNFAGCKRKFPNEEALQAHKRRAHAPPTQFKCPTCHQSFASRQNLNRHVKTVHEKSRPFECELCGKDFQFKDGLERHISSVHEQSRPHSCPHCPMKFKTKSHLNSHLVSVHPDMLKKE